MIHVSDINSNTSEFTKGEEPGQHVGPSKEILNKDLPQAHANSRFQCLPSFKTVVKAGLGFGAIAAGVASVVYAQSLPPEEQKQMLNAAKGYLNDGQENMAHAVNAAKAYLKM